MAKRLDLPEEQESGGQEAAAGDRAITGNRTLTGNRALTRNAVLAMEQTYAEENNGTSNPPPPRTSKVIKLILWAVLIIVAFPVFLGVGGGLLGLAAVESWAF